MLLGESVMKVLTEILNRLLQKRYCLNGPIGAVGSECLDCS